MKNIGPATAPEIGETRSGPCLPLEHAWPYRLILAIGFGIAIVNYLRDFLLYPWSVIAPLGPEWLATAFLASLAAVVCLYSRQARARVNAIANRLLITVSTVLNRRNLDALLSVRDNDFRVPPARVLLTIAALAAAVVALDIGFNLRAGLLTGPPIFDGAGYMMDAKRLFLASRNPLTLPYHTIHLHYWGQRAYLWHAALAVSYLIFGVGEWQSYTARWWPVFLYLTLVYGIVSRRALPSVTWAIVLVSALLPILTPCVRAALWDALSGKTAGGFEWYQADLRPDLLFTVFVSMTAALLLESADRPDGRVCGAAGIAFGFSLFTKPSAIAESALAAFLPALFIILRHWRKPLEVLACAGGFLASAGPLVWLYILTGGLEYTLNYLTVGFTRDLPIYRNAATAGWNALPYYFTITTYQIGHWEWLLLITGLVSAAVRRDGHCLRYYLVGAALFFEVMLSPSTNLFLSYGFLLLLWLGACLGIAGLPFAAPGGRLRPLTSFALRYATPFYCMVLIAGGVVCLGHRDAKIAAASKLDRGVVAEEEADVARSVGRDGKFAMMNQFGFPATMEFDWLGRVQNAPQWDQWYDPRATSLSGSDPLPGWRSCRAVLVYAEPMPQVAQYAFEPQVVWPVWDRLRADLVQPGSRFHLVRTYPLSSRPLTVQLWVSDGTYGATGARRAPDGDGAHGAHVAVRTVTRSASRRRR